MAELLGAPTRARRPERRARAASPPGSSHAAAAPRLRRRRAARRRRRRPRPRRRARARQPAGRRGPAGRGAAPARRGPDRARRRLRRRLRRRADAGRGRSRAWPRSRAAGGDLGDDGPPAAALDRARGGAWRTSRPRPARWRCAAPAARRGAAPIRERPPHACRSPRPAAGSSGSTRGRACAAPRGWPRAVADARARSRPTSDPRGARRAHRARLRARARGRDRPLQDRRCLGRDAPRRTSGAARRAATPTTWSACSSCSRARASALAALLPDARASVDRRRAPRREAALDVAQPLVPVVRRLTAPAARRYVAGWFGRARSTCSPRACSRARASNVPGSREMLLLAPGRALRPARRRRRQPAAAAARSGPRSLARYAARGRGCAPARGPVALGPDDARAAGDRAAPARGAGARLPARPRATPRCSAARVLDLLAARGGRGTPRAPAARAGPASGPAAARWSSALRRPRRSCTPRARGARTWRA